LLKDYGVFYNEIIMRSNCNRIEIPEHIKNIEYVFDDRESLGIHGENSGIIVYRPQNASQNKLRKII